MLTDLFNENEDEGTSLTSTFAGGRISLKRPPEPRAECGFIGLENQGATCYLNSLLQSMYMTPELRNGLLSIDPIHLGVENVR